MCRTGRFLPMKTCLRVHVRTHGTSMPFYTPTTFLFRVPVSVVSLLSMAASPTNLSTADVPDEPGASTRFSPNTRPSSILQPMHGIAGPSHHDRQGLPSMCPVSHHNPLPIASDGMVSAAFASMEPWHRWTQALSNRAESVRRQTGCQPISITTEPSPRRS